MLSQEYENAPSEHPQDKPMQFDSQMGKFRRMKERLAEILGRAETNQEDFDNYIRLLHDHEACKYMTGVGDIVSLCNFPSFKCQFRSKDKYGFSGSDKFECRREKIVRLRRLL